MNKFGGLLLIGALALTGCTAATPEPEPTIAAPTYLEIVRGQNAYLGATDSALNDIGQSLCDALAEGTTEKRALELLGLGPAGISPAKAEVVLYAAANEFCPQLAS
jgi:hypothetical protein